MLLQFSPEKSIFIYKIKKTKETLIGSVMEFLATLHIDPLLCLLYKYMQTVSGEHASPL